jgi:hypothetical protein
MPRRIDYRLISKPLQDPPTLFTARWRDIGDWDALGFSFDWNSAGSVRIMTVPVWLAIVVEAFLVVRIAAKRKAGAVAATTAAPSAGFAVDSTARPIKPRNDGVAPGAERLPA